MPWQFRTPDGRTLSYPTQDEDRSGMSFEEARARARREIDPALVNTDNPRQIVAAGPMAGVLQGIENTLAGTAQFGRDMGDAFMSGIGSLVVNPIGQAINRVDPTVDTARREGRTSIGDYVANAGRDYAEREQQSLSPEMQRELHSGNLSPGNVAYTGAQSLPTIAPTLGIAALTRGAALPSMAAEGALGGYSVADQIDESVRDFAATNPDEFISSPLGRQALQETNGHYGRAVELAANRAKAIYPELAGIITAGISRFPGEDIGAVFRGTASAPARGLFVRTLLGAGREGAEEALQSGQEQVFANLGLGSVNSNQDIWQDVPQSALMGGLSAAPLGGAFGAMRGQAPSMQRPQQQQPPQPAAPGAQPPPNPSGPALAAPADLFLSEQAPPPGLPGPQTAQPQPSSQQPSAPPNAQPVFTSREDVLRADQALAARIDSLLNSSQASSSIPDIDEDAEGNPLVPPAPDGAERTIEGVPLFRMRRGISQDPSILRHFAPIRDALGGDLPKSATFNTLLSAENSLFERPNPKTPDSPPDGWGVRIIDTLPGGQTKQYVFAVPWAESPDEAQQYAEQAKPSIDINEPAPKPAAPAPQQSEAAPPVQTYDFRTQPPLPEEPPVLPRGAVEQRGAFKPNATGRGTGAVKRPGFPTVAPKIRMQPGEDQAEVERQMLDRAFEAHQAANVTEASASITRRALPQVSDQLAKRLNQRLIDEGRLQPRGATKAAAQAAAQAAATEQVAPESAQEELGPVVNAPQLAVRSGKKKGLPPQPTGRRITSLPKAIPLPDQTATAGVPHQVEDTREDEILRAQLEPMNITAAKSLAKKLGVTKYSHYKAPQLAELKQYIVDHQRAKRAQGKTPLATKIDQAATELAKRPAAKNAPARRAEVAAQPKPATPAQAAGKASSDAEREAFEAEQNAKRRAEHQAQVEARKRRAQEELARDLEEAQRREVKATAAALEDAVVEELAAPTKKPNAEVAKKPNTARNPEETKSALRALEGLEGKDYLNATVGSDLTPEDIAAYEQWDPKGAEILRGVINDLKPRGRKKSQKLIEQEAVDSERAYKRIMGLLDTKAKQIAGGTLSANRASQEMGAWLERKNFTIEGVKLTPAQINAAKAVAFNQWIKNSKSQPMAALVPMPRDGKVGPNYQRRMIDDMAGGDPFGRRVVDRLTEQEAQANEKPPLVTHTKHDRLDRLAQNIRRFAPMFAGMETLGEAIGFFDVFAADKGMQPQELARFRRHIAMRWYERNGWAVPPQMLEADRLEGIEREMLDMLAKSGIPADFVLEPEVDVAGATAFSMYHPVSNTIHMAINGINPEAPFSEILRTIKPWMVEELFHAANRIGNVSPIQYKALADYVANVAYTKEDAKLIDDEETPTSGPGYEPITYLEAFRPHYKPYYRRELQFRFELTHPDQTAATHPKEYAEWLRGLTPEQKQEMSDLVGDVITEEAIAKALQVAQARMMENEAAMKNQPLLHNVWRKIVGMLRALHRAFSKNARVRQAFEEASAGMVRDLTSGKYAPVGGSEAENPTQAPGGALPTPGDREGQPLTYWEDQVAQLLSLNPELTDPQLATAIGRPGEAKFAGAMRSKLLRKRPNLGLTPRQFGNAVQRAFKSRDDFPLANFIGNNKYSVLAAGELKRFEFARKLKAEGKDPHTIWNQTRVAFDPGTGEPMIRLDNRDFQFKDNFLTWKHGGPALNDGQRSFRLEEIVDAGNLFNRVPIIRDLSIKVMRRSGGGSFKYDEKKRLPQITLYVGGKTDTQILSDLVHEIDHFLQFLFRFSEGGTVEHMLDLIAAGEDGFGPVDALYNELADDVTWEFQFARKKPFTDLERQLYQRAYALYFALQGEVMSREAEAARTYTDEQMEQPPVFLNHPTLIDNTGGFWAATERVPMVVYAATMDEAAKRGETSPLRVASLVREIMAETSDPVQAAAHLDKLVAQKLDDVDEAGFFSAVERAWNTIKTKPGFPKEATIDEWKQRIKGANVQARPKNEEIDYIFDPKKTKKYLAAERARKAEIAKLEQQLAAKQAELQQLEQQQPAETEAPKFKMPETSRRGFLKGIGALAGAAGMKLPAAAQVSQEAMNIANAIMYNAHGHDEGPRGTPVGLEELGAPEWFASYFERPSYWFRSEINPNTGEVVRNSGWGLDLSTPTRMFNRLMEFVGTGARDMGEYGDQLRLFENFFDHSRGLTKRLVSYEEVADGSDAKRNMEFEDVQPVKAEDIAKVIEKWLPRMRHEFARGLAFRQVSNLKAKLEELKTDNSDPLDEMFDNQDLIKGYKYSAETIDAIIQGNKIRLRRISEQQPTGATSRDVTGWTANWEMLSKNLPGRISTASRKTEGLKGWVVRDANGNVVYETLTGVNAESAIEQAVTHLVTNSTTMRKPGRPPGDMFYGHRLTNLEGRIAREDDFVFDEGPGSNFDPGHSTYKIDPVTGQPMRGVYLNVLSDEVESFVEGSDQPLRSLFAGQIQSNMVQGGEFSADQPEMKWLESWGSDVGANREFPPLQSTEQFVRIGIANTLYAAAINGYDSIAIPTGETEDIIQGNTNAKRGQFYDTTVKNIAEKLAATYGMEVSGEETLTNKDGKEVTRKTYIFDGSVTHYGPRPGWRLNAEQQAALKAAAAKHPSVRQVFFNNSVFDEPSVVNGRVEVSIFPDMTEAQLTQIESDLRKLEKPYRDIITPENRDLMDAIADAEYVLSGARRGEWEELRPGRRQASAYILKFTPASRAKVAREGFPLAAFKRGKNKKAYNPPGGRFGAAVNTGGGKGSYVTIPNQPGYLEDVKDISAQLAAKPANKTLNKPFLGGALDALDKKGEQMLRKVWSKFGQLGVIKTGVQFLDGYFPFGGLPDRVVLEAYRSLAQGRVGQAQDIAAHVAKAVAEAYKISPADAMRALAGDYSGQTQIADRMEYARVFLTTRSAQELNAAAQAIGDPDLVDALTYARKTILDVGRALVEHHIIHERQFMSQAGKDASDLDSIWGGYLRRAYAEHFEDARHSAGIRASGAHYRKRRENIPKAERLGKGEITDLPTLIYLSIEEPLRDIGIYNYYNAIMHHAMQTKNGWVLPETMVWFGGKVRSAWFVAQEKKQNDDSLAEKYKQLAGLMDMRKQAQSTGIGAKAAHGTYGPAIKRLNMEIAILTQRSNDMDAIIKTVPEYALAQREGKLPEGYRRIPEDPSQFGDFAGAVVMKQIYDDAMGGATSIETDRSSPKARAERMWKGVNRLTKFLYTVANPPTHFRNFLSNMLMLQRSGTNVARVLPAIRDVVDYARTGRMTPSVEAAIKHGAMKQSFTEAETRAMDKFLKRVEVQHKKAERAGNFWNKMGPAGLVFQLADDGLSYVAAGATAVGDFASTLYQLGDIVFKVAKIADELDRGTPPVLAALEAREIFFDYSAVHPTVRFLRTYAIAPFISYVYFAVPKFIEQTATAPWRVLPSYLFYYGMLTLAASMLGLDDDDIDDAKRTLNEGLEDRVGLTPLPWRDEHGRIQWVDLGYLLPEGALMQSIVQAGEGDGIRAISSIGFTGGPVSQWYAGLQTGIDPFRQTPIWNDTDSETTKFALGSAYIARSFLPPTMNYYTGPIFPNERGGAGYEALFGSGVDSYGQPTQTVGQLRNRMFGLNTYPNDVNYGRQRRLARFQSAIRDAEIKLRFDYRNQQFRDGRGALTPRGQEVIQIDSAALRALITDAQQYIAETEHVATLEAQHENAQ